MYTRKSWREKLEKFQEPRLVEVRENKAARRLGSGLMLIARPLDVDALIRTVKKGKVVTVRQIRQALAEKFRADFTCPLTTGIFIRLSAEAAEEDRREGRVRITPYWRVVKEDGSLNPKFPGGAEAQAEKLRAEGHTIAPGRGAKPPRVAGFEARLSRL